MFKCIENHAKFTNLVIFRRTNNLTRYNSISLLIFDISPQMSWKILCKTRRKVMWRTLTKSQSFVTAVMPLHLCVCLYIQQTSLTPSKSYTVAKLCNCCLAMLRKQTQLGILLLCFAWYYENYYFRTRGSTYSSR